MDKSRILIVEDEIVVAHDLKSTLEGHGYEVIAMVSTAEEAEACARDGRPDLVLMDVVIKGDRDGISAAATMRETFEVPVIYLTAYSDEAILERAKATEPYGYIIKPFQERELHSAIEMALYKSRAERRIAHLNRVLRAIRNVNQMIVQEKDPQRLIERACECLVETRGYFSVWLALYDESEVLSITAQAGVEVGFDSLRGMLCDGTGVPCIEKAKVDPEPVSVENTSDTCTGCPLRNQYGGQGALAVRIEHDGNVLGFLVVSSPRELLHDEEETDLLREVALDLGLALNGIAVAGQRDRATRELHLKDQAFEHSIAALSIADADGIITQVNGAFLEQWGYGSREEAVGRSVAGFFVNDEDVGAVLEALQATGRWEGEFLARRADGSTFFSRGLATTLRDAHGGLIGYQSANLDVTQRKQAHVALRESEERYRDLYDNAPDMYVSVDARTAQIKRGNRTLLRALGYTAEEIVGQPIFKVYHPDSLEGAQRAFEAFRTTGEVREVELQLMRKDGSRIDVSLNVSAVRDDEGEITESRSTWRDISERKELERSLDEARATLQTAMDQSQAGIAVAAAPSGELLYVNQAGLRIRGADCEEVVNGVAASQYAETWSILDLDGTPLPEDDIPLSRAVKFGEASSREFIIRRAEGDDRFVWANAAPVVDPGGSVTGGVVVFLDVTDQRKAERERDSVRHQFVQAQKMEAVGLLAGGIAHDFNNLLTVINGYAGFGLRALKEDDPIRGDLQQILEAGQRASVLVAQLLAFSRRQPMDVQIVDLNEVIGDVGKMLKRLLGEDIGIQIVLAEGLGRVRADAAQLEQVLMNLAVNARDAMPEGGRLTIETANVELDEEYARRHPDTVAGPHVMMAVTDTGTGVDPEIMEQIFDPFFTTKQGGRGTGLGLSSVYGIVKQTGGNIWIYSEPGEGTTFKVYLPRVEAEKTERARPRSGGDLRGAETILLVEDDDAVRTLTERILTSAGYTVIAAASGSDALSEHERYGGATTLLLTDVVMPGMSGKDLAARLAEITPGLKVLYMSGYTDNAIVHHGVLDADAEFIGKPCTREELLLKVRSVLDGD